VASRSRIDVPRILYACCFIYHKTCHHLWLPCLLFPFFCFQALYLTHSFFDCSACYRNNTRTCFCYLGYLTFVCLVSLTLCFVLYPGYVFYVCTHPSTYLLPDLCLNLFLVCSQVRLLDCYTDSDRVHSNIAMKRFSLISSPATFSLSFITVIF